MSTSVKYTHSDLPNAPTLSTTLGSMISVLDAVLVSGFGLVSMTSGAVAGNVCTLNFGSGHSFEAGMVASVAGATPAGLNGDHRVLTVAGTAITFATTGIADGVVSGSVTAKVAPLGWTKQFSATNVGCYRSATGKYLQVDDTSSAYNVIVRGYSNMTDASTGTGPFPTPSQAGAIYWWRKGSNAVNDADIPWTIIGDDQAFYFSCATMPGSAMGPTMFFGSIVSNKVGDSAATVITGGTNTSPFQGVVYECVGYHQNTSSLVGTGYIEQSHSEIGGAQVITHSQNGWRNNPGYSGVGALGGVTFPNGSDNSLLLDEIIVVAAGSVRGKYPGVYGTGQPAQSLNWRDTIPGAGATAGRTLFCVKAGPMYNQYANGTLMFDITGPWR